MTPPPDTIDKDAIIAALLAQVETLTAANARLCARIAELEGRLDADGRARAHTLAADRTWTLADKL